MNDFGWCARVCCEGLSCHGHFFPSPEGVFYGFRNGFDDRDSLAPVRCDGSRNGVSNLGSSGTLPKCSIVVHDLSFFFSFVLATTKEDDCLLWW